LPLLSANSRYSLAWRVISSVLAHCIPKAFVSTSVSTTTSEVPRGSKRSPHSPSPCVNTLVLAIDEDPLPIEEAITLALSVEPPETILPEKDGGAAPLP
jgi:hypothetical protein